MRSRPRKAYDRYKNLLAACMYIIPTCSVGTRALRLMDEREKKGSRNRRVVDTTMQWDHLRRWHCRLSIECHCFDLSKDSSYISYIHRNDRVWLRLFGRCCFPCHWSLIVITLFSMRREIIFRPAQTVEWREARLSPRDFKTGVPRHSPRYTVSFDSFAESLSEQVFLPPEIADVDSHMSSVREWARWNLCSWETLIG